VEGTRLRREAGAGLPKPNKDAFSSSVLMQQSDNKPQQQRPRLPSIRDRTKDRRPMRAGPPRPRRASGLDEGDARRLCRAPVHADSNDLGLTFAGWTSGMQRARERQLRFAGNKRHIWKKTTRVLAPVESMTSTLHDPVIQRSRSEFLSRC